MGFNDTIQFINSGIANVIDNTDFTMTSWVNIDSLSGVHHYIRFMGKRKCNAGSFRNSGIRLNKKRKKESSSFLMNQNSSNSRFAFLTDINQ